MADLTDVVWNQEARDKILTDADRVLQDAVREVAAEHEGDDWEPAFAALNERLKGRFIDYEPGPDVRKYAEAIARGDYS
jgi:hypothetical protein